ncbi:MAG: (2Fe-2S) ferredoxin domain-containing protein [Bacteroidales bacterium]|jgi:NADH:ubiquinone oxidoreductase subunit E|nr:(2Fe-2S) ferredoxin domain-containing protein [Bacteroidales bacterium]
MAEKYELQICLGSSCFSRGNRELVQFIREYLKKNHLDDRIVFRGARCMGHCTDGPVLIINGRITEKVGMSEIEQLLDMEFGRLV